MVLPNRPSNFTPIPNNPFYSPLSDYLGAASGPLVVGNGLTVNYQTGEIEVLISATPVTGLQAGTGIDIANLGSGVFEISSTGVQGLIPGYGITISPQPFGQYLISTTCSQGTVTSITAGAGLTGGIITTAGTIALRNIDPPVSGCYVYPTNMTVDTYGRVTAVTQGVPSIPVSLFGAKGQLAVGVGPSQAVALPVGDNSLVLTADSTCPTGIKWAPVGETAVSCIEGASPICITGPTFNPTISIQPATLTTCGAVRLVNSTGSPSVDAALTAAAGCCLQQQINALAPYSGTVSSVSVVSPLVISGDPTVNPTIAVCSASVLGSGVVQLNDTTCSTSDTQALTANQGRALQNQINALATGLGANLAGTFDGSLNQVINVTPTGSSLGFVSGNPLPAASPANASYYVIVEVPGIMTPPGGVPTTVGVGDWWLSDGFVWVFLNVGASPPTASTTVQGIVELATNAETQAGTDTTRAIVPSALQSKVSDCCNLASSTTIASSQAVKSVYDLALTGGPYATQFTAGTVCFATASETFLGLVSDKAVTPATLQGKVSDSTALPNSCYIASSLAVATVNALATGAVQNCLVTNCGQILVGCQSGCVRNFPAAPNNGCVLTSCSSNPYGICWAPPATGGGGTVTSITAGSGLCGGTITGSGTISLKECICTTNLAFDIYPSVWVGFGTPRPALLNAGSVGVGAYALSCQICQNSIQWNTGVGYAAMGGAMTTPWGENEVSNTAIGAFAMRCMQGGFSNVALGFGSHQSGSSCQLVSVGVLSGDCGVKNNTVLVGSYAGSNSYIAGGGAPCTNMLGVVGVGDSALASLTSTCATNIVAIGVNAGLGAKLQCENVFVGPQAGLYFFCNCPDFVNCVISIGTSAAACGMGNDSIYIGNWSGALCLAFSPVSGGCPYAYNTFVGNYSGFCSCYVTRSVFIGGRAGQTSQGRSNVYIGNQTGAARVCGDENTIIGEFTAAIPTGFPSSCDVVQMTGNTIIGAGNMVEPKPSCNNIILGSTNQNGLALNDSILIGNNLVTNDLGIPNASVVMIGDAGCDYYYGGGGWSNPSDQSVKTCICDSALGLSFLQKIPLREFTWNYEEENVVNGKRCVGVVAQEVLQAICSTSCAEHLGLISDNGGKLWLSNTNFIWPLMNAVKELSAENTALKTRLDDLETRLTALGG